MTQAEQSEAGADAGTLAMLGDSIRGSLADYPERLGLGKAEIVGADAVDGAMATAVEQGWLAIAAPETAGGLDLGMAGMVLLATEIGRRLAPGPFLTNAGLLPVAAMSGNAALGALASAVIAGERRVHLALPSRHGETTRWIVDTSAHTADVLCVDIDAGGRVELHVIAAAAISARQAFDPTAPAGELVASPGSSAEIKLALTPSEAGRLLSAVNLWIAAELLGVAESAGELSVAHAGQRKQFGQLIGSYQGLKHRIVDDYVLRQNGSAILGKAVKSWDARSADAQILAHAARAAASEAATRSTAHCIQVHGAMGYSWEHPAHLYYKRVRRLLPILGGAAQSLAAVGDMLVEKGIGAI